MSKLIMWLVTAGTGSICIYAMTNNQVLLGFGLGSWAILVVVILLTLLRLWMRKQNTATWALVYKEPNAEPLVLGYCTGHRDEAMRVCRSAVRLLCMTRGRTVMGSYGVERMRTSVLDAEHFKSKGGSN